MGIKERSGWLEDRLYEVKGKVRMVGGQALLGKRKCWDGWLCGDKGKVGMVGGQAL